MTARPDDATPEASTQAETMARPDRGMAEDGKGRGQVNSGKPGHSQFGGSNVAGGNAKGGPEGSESDRMAPGAASHKKADDLK